jgi:integrase
MSNTPKLCRHKGTSQGYVTLNGTEYYLGTWPAGHRRAPVAVRAAYDDLLVRWLAGGRRLPEEAPPHQTTINEVIAAFVKWSEKHYAPRERGDSAEVEGIKAACGVLSELFGRLPVASFGPKALKQVRERMIGLDWARKYVNKQINRLKRMFRWAVAEEMAPPTVMLAVSAVSAIRKGDQNVRDTEPIKPVPDAHIEAVLPHASAQVRAMIEAQRFSGARPGEVVVMRVCDVDRSGPVWVYTPRKHKTMHHGHTREIYLGPKAQAVLTPWLLRHPDPEEYLFSPAEAENERNARRSSERKTPRYPSHMRRNSAKRRARPKRPKRERYDTDSYRRAVEYACAQANEKARAEALAALRAKQPDAPTDALDARVFVPVWTPGRLRHNAGTTIRREYGIELARIILGHSTMNTTEIYAEADRLKAIAAMLKLG